MCLVICSSISFAGEHLSWSFEYPVKSKNAKDFIQVLLQRAPKSKTGLEDFYNDIVQAPKFIEDLPNYESAPERLAGVLIELFTWPQITELVKTNVLKKAGVRVKYHEDAWTSIWNQFRGDSRKT